MIAWGTAAIARPGRNGGQGFTVISGLGFYDRLITRHILRELVPTMRHGDKGGRAFD